jgi:hypothetical protein
MVEPFSPVLVIVPHSGSIDFVIVGLTPLDVYYSFGLRLNSHSMTYLSALPSFDEMKRKGYSFEYHSATKDYVSEPFAILRGGSNKTVGNILDNVLPVKHNYLAQFKHLAWFGTYQENRDMGNAAGGKGKGYRIDLGACDHNYDGQNQSGLEPRPRTNGGVDCFNSPTKNENINSEQQMDAVQMTVDKVRKDHGYERIYNDFIWDEAFAKELRSHVNAEHSRAEVSSNFVTLMDGNDGCSFHKDTKNCSEASYDWTCCMAITVQSESTNRLYRVVTNLNLRAACGRAMKKELKHVNFRQKLTQEMERINSSYREIYANHTTEEDLVPTATTFTNVFLKPDLPWKGEMDEECHILKYIQAASAPSRDFFLSAASSAICKLREQETGLSVQDTVGLLLIAIYMSSYHQFHAVVDYVMNDADLRARIHNDVAGIYFNASEKLFPGKFWGGRLPRFTSSSLNFKKVFVENQFNFGLAVVELKELLKLVNTCADKRMVTSKIKEMAASSHLPGLNVFRLQLFIPLAALCGLVLPEFLFHADYIEPAGSAIGGSFSTLNDEGFPQNRHQDILLNVCSLVDLERRHSLGEGLVCESHRGQKRFDLFFFGQDLYHLFWRMMCSP